LRASIMFGEFAREHRAQHVGDGQSALKGGDLDAAALPEGDVDRDPCGVETWLSISRGRGLRAAHPASASLGRAANARLGSHSLIARSSREHGDLPGRGAVLIDLADEPAAARGVGESDPLADPRGERGWIVVDKQFGGRSGDERAGGVAVEHEAGDELGAEDARLRDELQRLAGGLAIEWRGLRRDQDEIGREQG
jgi:hypothetical protein